MVRVIEVGHLVAGPSAGLIFSDLGFEVIKIEEPNRGDTARYFTGPSSGTFAYFNRNKKSLALNLKHEKGKEVFFKLVKTADILIDNLGFGTMNKLGLDYQVLSQQNQKLIYLSIKGYAKGPYEKRNSLDFPIEVHSGIAYMTGLKNRPMRLGASIVDISAAMLGVILALKALIEREKTGKGKYLEVGLFETAILLVGQHIASYQINNNKPLNPINEEGFAWGIYDFFETKDGYKIFIGVTTDSQWQKFCKALNLSYCNDERFSTNEKRYEMRDFLIPEIAKVIKEYKKDELISLLLENNISFAELNKPWDLINDIHAKKYMVPVLWKGKEIMVPKIVNESNLITDPPELGENTEEILKELGYNENDIDYLKREKVI